MLDWLSAVLAVVPALRPDEVMAMDALVAIGLCAARRRQIERMYGGAAAGGDDGFDANGVAETLLPNGSKVRRFRGMEGLRSLLQSGG